LNKYDAAILDFNKSIELNPKFVDAYTNRGFAYVNNGQFEKSLIDFNKALEMGSPSCDLYLGKGIANFKMNDYISAISDITKALEMDPNLIKGYLILQRLLRDLPKWLLPIHIGGMPIWQRIIMTRHYRIFPRHWR
jgi:tetratricopeptide (TPR) repeat protein